MFALWFPLSSSFIFFSSPNLSGRRLDVYHTSTHGVHSSGSLECRSEMCCAQPAGNAGPKKSPTRTWANAQRDGRPAEYRWRPLFNAAKFG